MPITVVLAVGLDPWQLAAQTSHLKSAGFFFIPAGSIPEAVNHFKSGDFDIVLLGHSMSIEDKERLVFLIRRSGSRTPVVCIGTSPSDCESFADAMLANEPNTMLPGLANVLARQARFPAA